MLTSDPIIIIGAGPTGLGAAWRLQEQGEHNWHLYDLQSYAGGLAASYVDDKGFTWDFGGHVQFSHYQYFDRVMDAALGKSGWLHHQRESWVWIRDRFVPYPFQNNIRRLPHDELVACLLGLMEAAQAKHQGKPKNFEQWIRRSFGNGIAEVFMAQVPLGAGK